MQKVLLVINSIGFGADIEIKCQDLAKQLIGGFDVSLFLETVALDEVGEWFRMKGIDMHTSPFDIPKDFDSVILMDEWAQSKGPMFPTAKKINFVPGQSIFSELGKGGSSESFGDNFQSPNEMVAEKTDFYKKKVADIVIPHHDRHDRLKECLENLDRNLFNIIVVSGGSFAQNCNKGAKLAVTENIIFMNDDIIPKNEYLLQMCEMDADIVGASQQIDGQTEIFYGINFDKTDTGELKGRYAKEPGDALIPCGFLFLAKKEAWEKLGGFNEEFRNGGEDSDLGIRALKEGLSIKFFQQPTLHFHSQSLGRLDYSRENQTLLNQLWNNEEGRNIVFKTSILVATNHLSGYGGSETYCYTLVKELERLGNKVDVLTFAKGLVSDRLNNVVDRPKDAYDLILISHSTCLEALKDVSGPKVFTSHGIYPRIEQPAEGANKYVAISEEVKAHLNKCGFESEIIFNGVDCDRYKPENNIRKDVKKVLSLCHGEEANKNIAEACKELGLEFEFLTKSTWDVENKINDADLVFSLGRGVYESMACGREVIVYDSRSYVGHSLADGIVTPSNIKEIMENNCSGRRYELDWKVEDIIKEIKKYDYRNGEENRKFALDNFDIKEKAKEYLNIFKNNEIR